MTSPAHSVSRKALAGMTRLSVECYSGFRADERPVRFRLGGQTLEVEDIEDRWHSPDARYFRVRARDGNTYVLRHDELPDEWSLEAFRARSPAS